MPPFPLVRPRVRSRPAEVGEALLVAEPCTALRARGGFAVMRLRLRGGSATRRKSRHLELGQRPLQRQSKHVADAHPMTGLDAFGVQMNLAAVDGGGGKRTRLVETALT